MRDAVAENPGGEVIALPELTEVASQMPAVGRALIALHRRHQEALERLEAIATELGDGRGDIARGRPMPFEVVCDFFFAHQNYFDALDFAGALLLPYGAFLGAAESLRYDIDQLARRFGVGFETVCHRLSTLQRPEAPGVPFFFIRVDRAGNISKRQSATHLHFSKTGGTCPLWNVYEAFAQPGRILPQLARMPDGRAYLWIARTVSHGQRGFGSPSKTFSIGLGCDARYAPRLVYAKGLDLKDPEVPTPIGMGCKVCERMACPQRAFPFVGRPLDVNENEGRFTPYAVAGP